jgi:hypothetical protein
MSLGMEPLGRHFVSRMRTEKVRAMRTDSARKHLFIVHIALNPRHEMFNVFRGGHLGWTLEVLRVLPEILESRYD